MCKLICATVAFLIAAIANAQNPPTSNPPVTVIFAGTLIDGTSETPRKNQMITIRGNRIEKVEPRTYDQFTGRDAAIIDLSHATVLPGLIDDHTHIFLQGEDPATGGWDGNLLYPPLALRAARAAVSARRALEQGFTSLRDMGTEGAGYGDVGLKQGIERGYFPGPRMWVSTLAISTTGGYGVEGYAPETDDRMPKGVALGDGPVELRKIARDQIAKGADLIKVYMTHRSWVGKHGELVSQPTLTVEELKAIVDEAHGQQRKVACHAYGGIGLHRALDGGCDSIEHGLDLDDAAIAQMLRQGTWLVPTLSVYYENNAPADTSAGKRDLARINAHKVSFQKAVKAGVRIAFGTDMGGMDWKEPIAQEFPRMVEFGMTPMQAIQAATSRAAELLDMQGQLGVIAPGAYADLTAVAGDPLADVNVLKNVGFVMKDGKVFKNELK